MTGVERTARIVSALAMLGLVPALAIGQVYVGAERARAAWPALERALHDFDQGLERSVECDPGGRPAQRLSSEQYGDIRGSLSRAASDVGMAAQVAIEAWPNEWLGDLVPGVGPLLEVVAAEVALARMTLNWLEDQYVCGLERNPTPTRMAQEQARADGIFAEARPRLAAAATQFASARASLEAGRPVLTALAWILGLIEVVGWAVTLWLLPRDLRTLMARRAARRGGAS